LSPFTLHPSLFFSPTITAVFTRISQRSKETFDPFFRQTGRTTEDPAMQAAMRISSEQEIAQAVLSALPAGAARLVRDDGESLRYSVNAPDLKLNSVVFRKESLRALQSDPAREVKLEYLARDIARSARRRTDYSYPRTSRITFGLRSRRSSMIRLAPAR
jgi:hypothetical protein